ncbi:hypothetical protein [Roseibium suaedae]|uniref:Uncharacterized protein n=1 Tax=Roseibium suaedae TaxID=735517 RepID=A0A1M7K9T2_9HYPH|nr:hypothetical protein [Roseibium suaedae]SHM62040.1 hypothetical protein SAMN05444272_2766 [Roseibium suaedae]
MIVPSHITHYYSRAQGPLRNLSDLSEAQAADVIADLAQRRLEDPAFKRVFGRTYMELRRRTEDRLRALFVSGGGKPERSSPHYFVLGSCDWFAGLYPDTGVVSLDWRDLPQETTSFTYPDSFISMRLGEPYGLPPVPLQDYHEKVFRLEQLDEMVAAHGLPEGGRDTGYQGYHTRPFEKYIEVQIWSDGPVSAYLGTSGTGI